MADDNIQNNSAFISLKSFLKEYRRKRTARKVYASTELDNPGSYYSRNCFDYYKCIFIHIPKTAGLSVCKTLFGNLGGGHRSIEWYLERYGSGTVKKYFTFTFVRNPWDRLHSSYHFLMNGGMNEFDKQFYKDNLQSINSFEAFVMDWLTKDKLSAYWHFIPQYKFITTKDNIEKVAVSFVGRFENIEHDFAQVCTRLKMKKGLLPKENVTQKNAFGYKTAYTSAMIDKVADLYNQDIRLFNYTF